MLRCLSLLVFLTACGGSSAAAPRARVARDDYTPERSHPAPAVATGATLLDGIEELSTGGIHSCARTQSGRVYCWGNNEYGQLGDGTETQRTAPVLVDGLDRVVETSAGHFHTCVRLQADGLACWGMNTSGQLGSGDEHSMRDRPVPVPGLAHVVGLASATDGDHTCAVTPDAHVWCWGENSAGELGDG